jgi:hypothetical protein
VECEVFVEIINDSVVCYTGEEVGKASAWGYDANEDSCNPEPEAQWIQNQVGPGTNLPLVVKADSCCETNQAVASNTVTVIQVLPVADKERICGECSDPFTVTVTNGGCVPNGVTWEAPGLSTIA